jgi:hypothetical protein
MKRDPREDWLMVLFFGGLAIATALISVWKAGWF